MAGTSFRCRVVTPTAALVDDRLTYASIPCWDGLMGVAPGRAPILARLGMGELRLDFADTAQAKGGSRTFLVDGGFVKMAGDELTILAEKAWSSESLTVAEAEAELKALESPKAAPAGAKAGTGAGAVDAATRTAALARDKARARKKIQMAREKGAI